MKFGSNFLLWYTYDASGNKLTFKDNREYLYERTYDSNNNRVTFKDSNGYSSERTYNADSNELTFKNSNGYSSERTYNANNNNRVTFQDSNGYLSEYTRDSNKKGNSILLQVEKIMITTKKLFNWFKKATPVSIVPGDKWRFKPLESGDPFPLRDTRVITILAYKNKWVRYYINKTFSDERLSEETFRAVYVPHT